MKIYTTVFAFESFTKQIGGKYVDVDTIYPPGADMHTYEPSQRDMINIAKVIYLFIQVIILIQ